MRVALACDFFLKYTLAQAVALSNAGAQVTLVIRDHAHEFGGDRCERDAALQRATDAGVLVLEVPGRLMEAAAIPALVRVRRRIQRTRPQVVHVQDKADPRAVGVLPVRPTVMTIHDPMRHPGQPVAPLHKRWMIEGSRWLWRRRAQAFIVHSDRLGSVISPESRRRCVVIPHGIELSDSPLPVPSPTTVGFFGRLVPYKGLDVLARAMPLVWEARPDVRLVIAGTGDTPFTLDDSRVDYRGEYLREADMESFFREISLAVLPYTEASQTGAGSVAVGYGVPIVVSDVGGLPDLALDESYVVRSGDDAALAAAIIRHVDDGRAVRDRLVSEIARPRSWSVVAQQLLDLYAEVLSHP